MTPTPEDMGGPIYPLFSPLCGPHGTPRGYDGVEFFGLPAGEMAELRRDAERFRRLERTHNAFSSDGWATWADDRFKVRLISLAEIADASPALTDNNGRNDG